MVQENLVFSEAPPPCLQPRSKNKLPLVIFCLVMITILTFLLWIFLPGLRSLTSPWISQCIPRTRVSETGEPHPPSPTATTGTRPLPMPTPTATPSASPRPMTSPTAPPLPSPPRVLSCPACGYPNCLSYVSCPFCGKPP